MVKKQEFMGRELTKGDLVMLITNRPGRTPMVGRFKDVRKDALRFDIPYAVHRPNLSNGDGPVQQSGNRNAHPSDWIAQLYVGHEEIIDGLSGLGDGYEALAREPYASIFSNL